MRSLAYKWDICQGNLLDRWFLQAYWVHLLSTLQRTTPLKKDEKKKKFANLKQALEVLCSLSNLLGTFHLKKEERKKFANLQQVLKVLNYVATLKRTVQLKKRRKNKKSVAKVSKIFNIMEIIHNTLKTFTTDHLDYLHDSKHIHSI